MIHDFEELEIAERSRPGTYRSAVRVVNQTPAARSLGDEREGILGGTVVREPDGAQRRVDLLRSTQGSWRASPASVHAWY